MERVMARDLAANDRSHNGSTPFDARGLSSHFPNVVGLEADSLFDAQKSPSPFV